MKKSVLLKCSKPKDDLPNACSGLVIIPVSSDGGNITTHITYGMGIYSVANFSQSLYVIETEVLGLFALGRSGWCGARYHLSSGDCLGLNTHPLLVFPPPEAPPLEDPSLRLVAPFVTKAPRGYKPSTTTWNGWGIPDRTEPTTTTTTYVYVHTTPAPGGLGAGGVILIVLILLLVGLVLGGLAYFYMQRNRIEEQRALRTTQEIELRANVAWEKEAVTCTIVPQESIPNYVKNIYIYAPYIHHDDLKSFITYDMSQDCTSTSPITLSLDRLIFFLILGAFLVSFAILGVSPATANQKWGDWLWC